METIASPPTETAVAATVLAYGLHDALALRAASFIVKKFACRCVLVGQQSTKVSEWPDVIGWNSRGESVVVEAKASRSDFRADASKWSRRGENGVGVRRVYIAPAGMIAVGDLPPGWGLIEAVVDAEPAPDGPPVPARAFSLARLHRIRVRLVQRPESRAVSPRAYQHELLLQMSALQGERKARGVRMDVGHRLPDDGLPWLGDDEA